MYDEVGHTLTSDLLSLFVRMSIGDRDGVSINVKLEGFGVAAPSGFPILPHNLDRKLHGRSSAALWNLILSEHSFVE